MSRIVSVSTALLVVLAGSLAARVAAATLVADVNPQEPQRLDPTVVGPIVPLGDKVLFVAQEPGSGRELWVSDGTPLGTKIVADTCAGPCPANFRFLGTASTGRVIFDLETSWDELWSSDGTRQGTFPLSAGSNHLLFLCMAPFENPAFMGGAIFVSATSQQGGTCRLWRIDGSREGSREVGGRSPTQLTAVGQQVFFVSSNLGVESLWVSDGTPAGTKLLQDFVQPQSLIALGSKVLFVAPGRNGDDLWVSDGTVPGTRQITHLAMPHHLSSFGPEIEGVAFFLADSLDLWRSDGTEAGTHRVTTLGVADPFPGPLFPVKLGDRLLFVANDPSTGPRLWVSRGTPETTAPVPCSGTCPRLDFTVHFALAGDQAFFVAEDNLHGRELWSTDGTATRLVLDACPGSCNGSPDGLIPIGDTVFFLVPVGSSTEIWKITAGQRAVRLQTFAPGNGYSGMDFFLAKAGGDRLFFNADNGDRTRQLWTSDGTPEGSQALTVIGDGDGSDPSSFTPLGNRLFFSACTGSSVGLWQSDGTPAGTVPITSARVTSCSDSSGEFHDPNSAGGLVFFRFGGGLWRSDGTSLGTFLVKPEIGNDLRMVAFGGQVVFSVLDDQGSSLWASDGSVVGTRPLFDAPGVTLEPLAAFGPDLYLASFPRESRASLLLISDGTPGGTREVATLDDVRSFRDLTRVGNQVYFIADTNEGAAIFSTDGSAQGTGRVPITDGSGQNPEPLSLAGFGGLLYFGALAADGTTGLFRTDGSVGGASLVRSFAQDGLSSLVVAGNRLFFPANDGEHGVELWESDGTSAGTQMVQDVAPGISSSSPSELTVVGTQLFFVADDGVHGREPWVHPLNAGAGCQPTDVALCLEGGRFRIEASWRDFSGHSGQGHAVALTADTGYFWFFSASNVEVILKVLDGRSINDHQWVFYGALSNVEYTLTITDMQTGAARRYVNPSGRLSSVADVQAFGPLGATGSNLTIGPEGVSAEPIVEGSWTAAKAGGCVASPARLCLNGGRFSVEAQWHDFSGNSGTGTAVPLSGDTGYFWFFGANNVEVVLKVLDGRPVNGKFWLFYGALSNVEYTLTVTDTQTGAVKTYTNPSGRLASVADTSAF